MFVVCLVSKELSQLRKPKESNWRSLKLIVVNFNELICGRLQRHSTRIWDSTHWAARARVTCMTFTTLMRVRERYVICHAPCARIGYKYGAYLEISYACYTYYIKYKQLCAEKHMCNYCVDGGCIYWVDIDIDRYRTSDCIIHIS